VVIEMSPQKIGFLFPGQGAQSVGMGREWAETFEKARRVYEEADRILGTSISKICFEGPEETLTRTLYAQPAIFVTSLALLSVLEEKVPELKPSFVAGLSLGEFTALVAVGSISFEEGLKLVQTRAELMEKAASRNPGTMISILGLDQAQCNLVAAGSGATLANLNAPDQFVLSGTAGAVEKAQKLAEERGAKRAIPLKVGGAFHSPLMGEAREGLREALAKVTIRPPQAVFVPNASAKGESNPEKIRQLLGDQVTSPVRWIETVQYGKGAGISRFIEIGPGRVLKGLVRKIDSSLEVLSFEKVADLEALEAALQKV
jgi:[acyl-carrier-protein] S-malonyltransferase